MRTLAWRAHVPADMVPLIGAVAIGGMVAGILAATPILLLTTPLVAAGLAVAAAFEHPAPAWKSVADETLAKLPDTGGEARYLLLDLIKRAAAVPASAQVTPLVLAACDAARQLAALEAQSSHRRGCDLLSQRLQEASAALSRWQAAQGVDAAESLGRLARELNEESRYQQEAAHEVETLLA